MTHLRRVVGVAVAAGLVVAADACHKTPPPAPPAAPVVAPRGPNQDSIAAAERARRDSAAAAAARAAAAQRTRDSAAAAAADARAAADAAMRDAAAMRASLTAVVHFDYDKADLRDDSKAVLDAKIPILRANLAVTLRIAGNTDDRGSDGYNLALGQRRAVAAKQYLVDRGIAENRIETISYGEEHKLCQQDEESCWEQNRRAEFEITGGGANLKKP